MTARLHVPERGGLAFLADCLILPIMRTRLFTHKGESPQLTHFWNNGRLDRSAVRHLDRSLMVYCDGDLEALPRKGKWDIRFHLGAWPTYVVLEPELPTGEWYVGWIGDTNGASQIPIPHRVRMLIGPNDVEFFGVKAETYTQIKLRRVGSGRVGKCGSFAQDPLH